MENSKRISSSVRRSPQTAGRASREYEEGKRSKAVNTKRADSKKKSPLKEWFGGIGNTFNRLFSARGGMDMPFFFLILVLLVVGIAMMFSASYAYAYYNEGNSYHYLIRQAGFAAGGIVVMIILSFFDYHQFHRIAVIAVGAAIILLVVVLFMPDVNGVRRWIDLGPINFQASEVLKFAIILFYAHWASVYFDKMGTFAYGVAPALVVGLPSIGLLLLEPHYSCIVIVAMLFAIMMWISGVRKRYFIGGIAFVVAAYMVLLVTDKLSYAMERLDGWGMALEDNLSSDMQWTVWQTMNSLYAIGSGGLTGLGLGQSREKYLYLPEPQNDFVFAVVVEELGLIGGVIILLIFVLLVIRGIMISLRAKDKFGMFLGVGLVSQIGLQVVLNILVITDTLPNTGISLPFFSYGGTSLLMLLAQMGIVLSISRNSNINKT